tara:strand:- start:123 stop:461 length:339 start_codon:yes stop_codon:yes gene_type:complete
MIECNNYSGVYILNEPINLNQLVYEIAKYLDVVKPKRVLPKNIGYYVAILGDLYHYLTKKNISFNSTIFSEMTNQARYDGSLVARCLKFKYRYSIRYTVKQLVMKYSEKKLI